MTTLNYQKNFIGSLLWRRLILITLTTLAVSTLPLPKQAHALVLAKPKIQQGINFVDDKHKQNDISQYLISEKLDGMRGFWTGEQLVSRQGNIINAPKWFTLDWPKVRMDGELWAGRDTFQAMMSCVKRKTSSQDQIDSCWQTIKFMIFDLPDNKDAFKLRVKAMNRLVSTNSSAYLGVIQQEVLKDTIALDSKLNDIIEKNGEGLMLHLASAHYQIGRSKSLLKLKRFNDAEARVIAHTAGKGKYTGMLGALKVETPEGIIFKIGSGFSDLERKTPPPVGSVITYRYNGYTKANVPRFARFWRRKPL